MTNQNLILSHASLVLDTHLIAWITCIATKKCRRLMFARIPGNDQKIAGMLSVLVDIPKSAIRASPVRIACHDAYWIHIRVKKQSGRCNDGDGEVKTNDVVERW